MRSCALLLSATLAAIALAASAKPAAAAPTPASRAEIAADPADSLYRVAREALNGGDYRRAASVFRDVRSRYPRSAYVGDAMYYEAFALSRTGDERDLRTALEVLRDQRKRFPDVATKSDAAALETSVQGKLAQRGNRADAAEITRRARGAVPPSDGACSDDDAEMRIAALNALMQMDEERAMPILKQVLARRDACSTELRRKAVFLVAQKRGDESADVLLTAARTDPDREVRSQAIFWLSEVGTERAAAALDSILNRTTDADLREKAIVSLGQHSDARSSRVLRDFAGGTGPDELRAKAVFWLGQGERRTPDAGPFLRTLFDRERSDEVRETIVQAVAERADADDVRWLAGVIENARLPLEVRKKALFWSGQQRAFPVSQLIAMYDHLDDQELREHAIWVLSERHESAATDKLIDVARHDPNREMRKKALFWLGQSDDPRVKQLLMEIIGQ